MPPLEHMDMVDHAVLWSIAKHDRDGFPLLSAPVPVCCRWEEKQIEMVDEQGQRIQVDVILAIPHNVTMGSLMWEGCTADLPASGDPGTNIYEVVARDRGKDLKGRVTRYEFGLKRYKDTLPSRIV